jgi:BASS family bile acid:Na+ symporter
MQAATNLLIPAAVVFLMWIVGLQLTPADFRRVAQYPRTAAVGTLGQLIVLPLIAGLAILTFRPAETVVVGMILIAAAPGAPISNLLVYLARGNIALSVTLTAITNTVGILTFPLLTAAGVLLYLGEGGGAGIPLGTMIEQLVLLMLLPIAIGMIVRAWRPGFVQRHRVSLKRASLLVVAGVVAFIAYDQRATFAVHLGSAAYISAFFTVSAMAIGLAAGRLLSAPRPDRIALLIEFPARNTAVAIVVAATTLKRLDYAVFIVAYFVVEMVIMMSVVALLNLHGRRSTESR